MPSPGDGGEPPPRGQGANPWWDNLAERRLDYITTRLTEVANSLSEVAKELRAQTRASDQQAGSLSRLEERLREAERELNDFPKRLERVASAEWMQRLETRVGVIEDEGRSPFVRRIEFDPVKKVVFGLVTSLCLAVLAAVAKLVMK